jgi:hypothetical protein
MHRLHPQNCGALNPGGASSEISSTLFSGYDDDNGVQLLKPTQHTIGRGKKLE